jgi:ABC-type multidrug transport system ATPase subunit
MKAIVADNLSKKYQEVQAIENISIDVNFGEIFGLIGPDGAGKTTIIRILTTLILADSGNANVNTFDVVKDYQKIRKSVGYMPGKFSLYEDLTVEENVKLFAAIFNSKFEENYNLIKTIYSQIEPFKNRLAGQLSGGMKQKLALSCALIHKPKILFLDEPTTGVDAVSRKEFWEMLIDLKNQGLAILVSTPYMDEASLCDRVGLIQNGKIMQIDTPTKIVQDFKHNIFGIESNKVYKILELLRTYPHTYSCYAFGDKIHYIDKRNKFDIIDIQNFLKENKVEDFTILYNVKPTIEDCFMDLMRHQ